MSNKNHDRKTFIVDSGAMSHMVNSEEKTTKLKDTKIKVTIGDSRTLTRKNLVIGTDIREVIENFIA